MMIRVGRRPVRQVLRRRRSSAASIVNLQKAGSRQSWVRADCVTIGPAGRLTIEATVSV
jgi:hypothetical protein